MFKDYKSVYCPLIIPCYRLLEAFSKSDDERDFYIDRIEGFLLYISLDKSQEELDSAYKEIEANPHRFCAIPKLTHYETKKIMEGFVIDKVYDIDTKEKLLNIIASREAKECFLEYIYDNLMELDKWQQYYRERFKIRIIEFLRKNKMIFVFEEDLDMPESSIIKLKQSMFKSKVPKDIAQSRSQLETKSKIYYSNEALNPRPRRGRPPKQQAKVSDEPKITDDFYMTVPSAVRPFIFVPPYSGKMATFSSRFENEGQAFANLKGIHTTKVDSRLEILSQRLESLRNLSVHMKKKDVEQSEKSFEFSEESKPKISGMSKFLKNVVNSKLGSIVNKVRSSKKNVSAKQVITIKKKSDTRK